MQPPQNPYSGFPSPNEPIPPAGGNFGGGVPPRAPEISFDAISQAWTLLMSGIGSYIGASFILGVVYIILEVLLLSTMPRDPAGQPQFSALTFVLSFVGGLVMSFFAAGFLRMAINHVKTGRAQFSDVFSGADVFGNMILAYILTAIATTIGSCFCLLPGLLLSGLFMFVFPLVVDKRMGAIEAISTSFNTLKPQMWMALGFIVVVSIISSLGGLLCGVGLLVTVPLAFLSIAITYNNFFGAGRSPITDSKGPIAPIADPRF